MKTHFMRHSEMPDFSERAHRKIIAHKWINFVLFECWFTAIAERNIYDSYEIFRRLICRLDEISTCRITQATIASHFDNPPENATTLSRIAMVRLTNKKATEPLRNFHQFH